MFSSERWRLESLSSLIAVLLKGVFAVSTLCGSLMIPLPGRLTTKIAYPIYWCHMARIRFGSLSELHALREPSNVIGTTFDVNDVRGVKHRPGGVCEEPGFSFHLSWRARVIDDLTWVQWHSFANRFSMLMKKHRVVSSVVLTSFAWALYKLCQLP